FLDPEAQDMTEISVADRLKEFGPALVGISCATPSFPTAKKYATIAKRISPDAVTIVGGVHATAYSNGVLNEAKDIDLCALGEGEETMLELANAIGDGPLTHDVLSPMKGIAFRTNGTTQANPKREWMKSLDDLPFPARDLVPF